MVQNISVWLTHGNAPTAPLGQNRDASTLPVKRFYTTKTRRWGNRPGSLWIAEDFGCCAFRLLRLGEQVYPSGFELVDAANDADFLVGGEGF
jgi:hypothetical protein